MPGAVIAVAGVAAAIAIGVVTPHFNEGASSAFYGRYDEVGGSPSGILETAVTDPAGSFPSPSTSGVSAIWPSLSCRWRCSASSPCWRSSPHPSSRSTSLSATPTQTSIHFHYTAGAIPALVGASVFGAAFIARRRARRCHLPAWCFSPRWWGTIDSTAAVLARASRRRDAAGLRDSRLRPRQGGGSGCRRRAGGCRRQRYELARRPSLGSPARAELPVCPRRAMDRG